MPKSAPLSRAFLGHINEIKKEVKPEKVLKDNENNATKKISQEQTVETSLKSLSSKDFTHPELLDNIDNPEKLKEILINLTKDRKNPIDEFSFDYKIKPIVNKDNIKALDIIISKRSDLSDYNFGDILKNINSDTNLEHFQKILECKIGNDYAFSDWKLSGILESDMSDSQIKT